MRQLMLSLDRNILDPSSAVAKRMIEIGKNTELFIVIPDEEKKRVELSPTVRIYSTGGSTKFLQFLRMSLLCTSLVPKEKIESVTSQEPFFLGMLASRIARLFKIPFEVQVHGDFFGSDFYTTTVRGRMKNVLARYVLRRATTIRTVGQRVKKSLVAVGIPEKKILVKPITLNTVSSIGTTDLALSDKPYFFWAGRMEPVKNLRFLIEAFRDVVKQKPEALLVLVGSGSEESLLKQQVKNDGLEKNILFFPWVASPFNYLKNAQALLFPSLSESYSAVAMEAHVAGTPIIMSNVGVANYELKEGPKVKIIKDFDKQKWVKAILAV